MRSFIVMVQRARCGHSSDWLVVRSLGVSIINLLVPISLESRCLWQHTVNLYLVGISISAK